MDLPKQTNYQTALDIAWDNLTRREPDEIEALGARRDAQCPRRWHLAVLDGEFDIDLNERTIEVAAKGDEGRRSPDVAWRILALHYLLADVPVSHTGRLISFEQIPEARGYARPYNGRVIGRFCATVGRERESISSAVVAIGAKLVTGGDLAARIEVFPHVSVTIIWYAGDDEFPPGASFLYEDTITKLLPVEDIVVTAERLVSRLSGKPW